MRHDPPAPGPVIAGWEALSAGDWARAAELFRAVCTGDGVPEAFEGLGAAAYCLDDDALSVSSYRRAFRLYRERGNSRGAARAGTALALREYTRGGDPAIVRGWLARTRRLLAGDQTSVEYAWLRHWEADVALLIDRDAETARDAAADAVVLARACGAPDLETLAVTLEGLALVSLGEVSEGMRLLDESSASAVAGEIGDVDAHLTACCYVIYACERAGDYERGAHWCDYARREAQRHGFRFTFSVCRSHYAGLLMAAGEWTRAESELLAAISDLDLANPPWAAEGVGRLADLRRRQGRIEEAEDLLARAERPPLRMMSGPDALLGRAAIALDAGDPLTAVGLAERYLRRIGPQDRAERGAGLRLLVQALVESSQVERAAAAADELADIAGRLGSAAARGWAGLAQGAVAHGRGDLDRARRCREDAVDHLHDARMPYDVALARLALAQTLIATGRGEEARKEAMLAAETFRDLGAAPALARAGHLVDEIAAAPPIARRAPGTDVGLTPRELEVLRLLAVGRGNEAIAATLVLSLRTVERHVSNVYLKLGLSGRVARAAAAAYAHQHGLLQDEPLVR